MKYLKLFLMFVYIVKYCTTCDILSHKYFSACTRAMSCFTDNIATVHFIVLHQFADVSETLPCPGPPTAGTARRAPAYKCPAAAARRNGSSGLGRSDREPDHRERGSRNLEEIFSNEAARVHVKNCPM